MEEVCSLLPEHINDDENLPPIVYSLEGTIQKKINYRETVANINTNNQIIYGTGLVSFDCDGSKFWSYHMVISSQVISVSLPIKNLDHLLLVVRTSEKQNETKSQNTSNESDS